MAKGNSNNRDGDRIATGVTAGQYELSNNGDNRLDAGATEPGTFAIGATNALTLDQSETQGYHRYEFTDASATDACTVTYNVTTPRGTFWVHNGGSEIHTHEISGQTLAKPRLRPGSFKVLVHDDTDGVIEQNGWEERWVSAAEMVARTTSGAAAGSVELATNKIMVATLNFDTAADEFAQATLRMSRRWDPSADIFITPVWSHNGGANFGVAWFFQALAVANDDALDAAFGTAVGSVDTGGTTDDLYIGPETAAITPAGSPAVNSSEVLIIQVYRDVSDAGDDLTVDARLHGFTIRYRVTSTLDD